MGVCFKEDSCLLVSQEGRKGRKVNRREPGSCLGRLGVIFLYGALPSDGSEERGKSAERKDSNPTSVRWSAISSGKSLFKF